MPAKGLTGRPCVYCIDGVSTKKGDHVLARQFVPVVARRAGLPIVPACEPCSHRKSEYERYISTVLAFGGRHEDAAAALAETPRRLAQNLKLADALRDGASFAADTDDGVTVRLTRALPYDGEQLAQLAAMIARGLLFHHWGSRLGADQGARAMNVTEEGDRFLIETFLSKNGDAVARDLAGGALSYNGLRAADAPHISVWRMQFFGGALSIEPTGERSMTVWAFTGNEHQIDKLLAASR